MSTNIESKGGRRMTGSMWVTVLLLAALSALFLPTAIILILGMLPTIVAGLTDRDPNRYAALTVGPMNMCGVLPQILELWQGGHSLEMALNQISSPFVWGFMLGAAGVGWFIYYAVPPMVAGVIQLRAESKLTGVTKDQKKLVEEWGPEVSGAKPKDDSEDPLADF